MTRDQEQSTSEKQVPEGQVSEVSGMDPAEADQPIYPDQATAGYPETESGEAEEGSAGPNARPSDDRPRGEGDG